MQSQGNAAFVILLTMFVHLFLGQQAPNISDHVSGTLSYSRMPVSGIERQIAGHCQ